MFKRYSSVMNWNRLHYMTCASFFALVMLMFTTSVMADILDEVKVKGTIRIGIGYMVPPMNYIDEKGMHVGFDVDIAKALAEELGLKHEIIQVNNTTRVSFLASRRVDLVISSMNHTRSRDEVIDFSQTYMRDGKRILAKKGRFKTLSNFVGKAIAVEQGSNAGTAVRDALKALGDPDPKIVSFQNGAECFLAVKTGKVDGYAQDSVILLGVSGGDPEFELVGDTFSPTYFSMGVPENESRWRDAINFALQKMFANGTYERIYKHWFGPSARYELPPSKFSPEIWAD